MSKETFNDDTPMGEPTGVGDQLFRLALSLRS